MGSQRTEIPTRNSIRDASLALCSQFALHSLCVEHGFYGAVTLKTAIQKLAAAAKLVTDQIQALLKTWPSEVAAVKGANKQLVDLLLADPATKLKSTEIAFLKEQPQVCRQDLADERAQLEKTHALLAERFADWMARPLDSQAEFFWTLEPTVNAALDPSRVERWQFVNHDEFKEAVEHWVENLPSDQKQHDVRSRLRGLLDRIRFAIDGDLQIHWCIHASRILACCPIAILLLQHVRLHKSQRMQYRNALRLILAEQRNQMGNVWLNTGLKSHARTGVFKRALADLDTAREEMLEAPAALVIRKRSNTKSVPREELPKIYYNQIDGKIARLQSTPANPQIFVEVGNKDLRCLLDYVDPNGMPAKKLPKSQTIHYGITGKRSSKNQADTYVRKKFLGIRERAKAALKGKKKRAGALFLLEDINQQKSLAFRLLPSS
jgi:hypothetical protein